MLKQSHIHGATAKLCPVITRLNGPCVDCYCLMYTDVSGCLLFVVGKTWCGRGDKASWHGCPGGAASRGLPRAGASTADGCSLTVSSLTTLTVEDHTWNIAPLQGPLHVCFIAMWLLTMLLIVPLWFYMISVLLYADMATCVMNLMVAKLQLLLKMRVLPGGHSVRVTTTWRIV